MITLCLEKLLGAGSGGPWGSWREPALLQQCLSHSYGITFTIFQRLSYPLCLFSEHTETKGNIHISYKMVINNRFRFVFQYLKWCRTQQTTTTAVIDGHSKVAGFVWPWASVDSPTTATSRALPLSSTSLHLLPLCLSFFLLFLPKSVYFRKYFWNHSKFCSTSLLR